MNPTGVDRTLVDWGNRVFNSSPVAPTKGKRGMTGLSLFRAARSGSPTTAAGVRKQLSNLVKRTPQVMVRISGGGRGIRHIKAHLDYISRNGQITVEDQNGNKFDGREDIDALRDDWQLGGFPIPEASEVRQAFNIILSMPAGTSEAAVHAAAIEFAKSEFANFQYAMALHTFDTDPDKTPSPNPHVHLCVKAVGLDGTRLNPRKHDLQRWREAFAKSLREHGIEADATRRLHRLQRSRGEKQSVRHKKGRGEAFHELGIKPPDGARLVKARQFESEMVTRYREIARALARSELAGDRALAIGLAKRVVGRDVEVPRENDRTPSR